ncbi:MAG: glycine--tRNA ligase subunit alpha [Alphaproteobacteria bacterium]|nr:MAG: glycine--tRNA ligase subunit alpha [Alphaproteobacteria bacterium]
MQKTIFKLQEYWANQGCVIVQPYDLEVGAGTSSPMTVLRALGDDAWACAYAQPSRRPTDGRYAENPNRTQMYYQFQVLMKPAPENTQELYLKSLEYIGLDLSKHDIRFVEDDWENPSLGASGLGWEVWCDGLEITQFTYFQTVGGLDLSKVSLELTYGVERIVAFMQGVESHFDIKWNDQYTYCDIFERNEVEFSHYNFTRANTDVLLQHFNDYEKECENLLYYELPLPAYDQCLKANHVFNLLDARGVISVTERAHYIARIRKLSKGCCEAYLSGAASSRGA